MTLATPYEGYDTTTTASELLCTKNPDIFTVNITSDGSIEDLLDALRLRREDLVNQRTVLSETIERIDAVVKAFNSIDKTPNYDEVWP